jgi:AAA family ATP:ADP antiporter
MPTGRQNEGNSRSRVHGSDELRRTILASSGFFLVLCSYYILRPVRDDMAVQFGVDRLQWLFTGTFIFTLMVVPLFGAVVKHVPTRYVLPGVYGFLILNLAGFQVAFSAGASMTTAAAFFIWLSVFNLFVVSLFWTRLGDTFSKGQSRRLYGYIAAGGTAGAIAGPTLTALLAPHVGTAMLIGLSSALLAAAAVCVMMIREPRAGAGTDATPAAKPPVGGSIVAGIPLTLRRGPLRAIALLIICYTTVSTVLYIELVDLAGTRFADSGERKAFFATVDLAVNVMALSLQLLGTRRIVQHAGLRVALSTMPAIVLAGLGVLGVWRTAISVAALQTVHRAGEYALSRPGREMIYTTVDPESRYKAKNFIDTAVYRASDAAGAWLIAGLRTAGADAVLFAAVPAALLWLATGFFVGKRHDE